MAPQASIVWKLFFVDDEDRGKAVCKICNAKLSRGTKPGCYTTTNMLKHLTTKHKEQLKEEEDKEKEAKEAEKKETKSCRLRAVQKKLN